MVDKILADIANQIAIRPHYDNFNGGKWVPAVKGQTFENISPMLPSWARMQPAK